MHAKARAGSTHSAWYTDITCLPSMVNIDLAISYFNGLYADSLDTAGKLQTWYDLRRVSSRPMEANRQTIAHVLYCQELVTTSG